MRESRETDEVLVCMAQRLQSQLERQLTLVERLQAAGHDEALADLAELRASVARTLRGSENLLVLGGAQQGPRVRGPRSVADVLADARAGMEDASRVETGPVPNAGIAPRAVAGLVALFTELLTHALVVSPAYALVEVASRRSEDGGVAVEVVADGPTPTASELDELNHRLADRPIIDDIVSNRVGLFVAARLARRSGAGLRVQPRRGGALPASGTVTVVHCPPDLLDAADFTAPDTARPRNHPAGGGRSQNGNGNGRGTDLPNGSNVYAGRQLPAPSTERALRPDPLPRPVRRDPEPALRNDPPAPPFAPPPVTRIDHGADELFGPLTSSLRDRMREAGPTPIYEAVASAWFIDGNRPPASPGCPPADWSTPSDAEWRAASERAARPETEEPHTAAGLPRRRPGTQMVAPPRRGSPAPPNASREREPERVRERLAVYQQGLDRGRHRADPGR